MFTELMLESKAKRQKGHHHQHLHVSDCVCDSVCKKSNVNNTLVRTTTAVYSDSVNSPTCSKTNYSSVNVYTFIYVVIVIVVLNVVIVIVVLHVVYWRYNYILPQTSINNFR